MACSDMELRHDEMKLLLQLMQIDSMKALRKFIEEHKGRMEPKDVKLVEAQFKRIQEIDAEE